MVNLALVEPQEEFSGSGQPHTLQQSKEFCTVLVLLFLVFKCVTASVALGLIQLLYCARPGNNCPRHHELSCPKARSGDYRVCAETTNVIMATTPQLAPAEAGHDDWEDWEEWNGMVIANSVTTCLPGHAPGSSSILQCFH